MDDKGIINLGLSKLGPTRVNILKPSSSPLEKKCAEFYPAWRRSELTKRRWVFNREFRRLTRDATAELQATADRKYAFALPSNSLRVIRDKTTTWMQRGRFIYSATSPLIIEHHTDADEDTFDPLFVDVLALRVALECVEQITQSNTKAAIVKEWYKEALLEAFRNNAFIIGPEDIRVEEADSEWEQARRGVGL